MDSAKFAAYAKSSKGPMGWMLAREARLLLAHEESDRRARRCQPVRERGRGRSVPRAHRRPRASMSSRMGSTPNISIPPATFKRIDTMGRLIVFTGQMDYRPNIEGVTWFVETILPHIRLVDPDVRFAIVGRNPTDAVKALARQPGVTVTGEVADVRGWLAAASVVVAPLKLARGIQNKVLEGMAMGAAGGRPPPPRAGHRSWRRDPRRLDRRRDCRGGHAVCSPIRPRPPSSAPRRAGRCRSAIAGRPGSLRSTRWSASAPPDRPSGPRHDRRGAGRRFPPRGSLRPATGGAHAAMLGGNLGGAAAAVPPRRDRPCAHLLDQHPHPSGIVLFIAPVIAWLVWQRRADLAQVRPQGWWPGLALGRERRARLAGRRRLGRGAVPPHRADRDAAGERGDFARPECREGAAVSALLHGVPRPVRRRLRGAAGRILTIRMVMPLLHLTGVRRASTAC